MRAACGAAVADDVVAVEPRAADVVARASGWLSRKAAGTLTPSISWRSSHTLATERAARVSSARSASARAVGSRAAVRRMRVQDVEVSRRRGGRDGSRRQVSRGDRDARPDLGGVAGGPARVEAVALAGEVGAADQVGRRLLRGLPGADPAQREALVDDAVDLPLEVRGDGAVPDGVGRQQGGGLLLAGGAQRAVVTPAAGDQGAGGQQQCEGTDRDGAGAGHRRSSRHSGARRKSHCPQQPQR